MDQHDIFESLARNAFDFLERGIGEFDKTPKFSVIHFCAAVEMLLKARLMKEHWSLIVSKPEQANLAKFMAGDFASVTMDEARARIRDIAGEDIADDAFNSFRTLANHRNKMIHFFHADVDSDGQAKAQIVAEHCRSWFHLHRLLNRWDTYFREFGAEISRADRAMKGHRKYLSAKFKALKPELDAVRKAGSKPKACSACGFKAAIPDELDDQIASLRCLVCDHTETQVEIDCPHCGKPDIKDTSALNVWQQSCQQLYLPRLKDDTAFQQTLGAGAESRDFFGFAQGKEDGRYVGFTFGKRTSLFLDSSLLLIEPVTAVAYLAIEAEAQRAAEEAARPKQTEPAPGTTGNGAPPPRVEDSAKPTYAGGGAAPQPVKKQFYGSIELDAIQAKKQFADLVDEVVQQFTIRQGVKVRIAIEIQADSATGFDDGLQRAVKENCNVLKFKSAEFEEGE